ncbi:aminopeptidase [Luteitalea sp. TBR-22]|uniref:M20/M25/M40 family metallo-hydrolase n=1 Tax=Luteitalea sp. TBR-22 TaxID=2802971 RepID=UPI001AF9CA85|nr:M20/M25/M40 family metallo-hydrolase [Luteitalea sp. TBR-22]BCS34358.1 aminopeptidase [Luteitalea sp. TBR-22]
MSRSARLLPLATLVLVATVADSRLPAQTAPQPARTTQASPRAPKPPKGPAGADAITDLGLRAHLGFIASDALEGRKAPSRGLDAAAAYLVAQLTRLGLKPAGDAGSYLQAIALTRRTVRLDKTVLAVGSKTLAYGDDFLPGSAPGAVEAGVVYVGNGSVIKSRGVDPYKGVDVTGKIVVTHMGLPSGFARGDLKGPQGEDWALPEAAARARGAVGVLYLPDYATLARWADTRDARHSGGSVSVDAFTKDTRLLPSATLSASGVGLLFSGQKVGAQEAFQRALRREPAEPFVLSGVTVRLDVPTTDEALTTNNVVAVLEGSDPALAGEYVALGAHYDHLGTAPRPDAAGDTIYNGADDDGSGTVGLLAIAEAFATTRPRPKRSLLFVWHTGEESGLWGSRYFTEHPTIPLDRVVAQLNIDMIGRGRPIGSPRASNPLALTELDSVYVVGSKRLSTELGSLVERVNAGYHGLRLDYTLDAPNDPANIYQRSDHYQYAKHGIPIAFFFTGVHEDYHGLDDEIDEIDFPKLRRISQTVYGIARELATRRDRPKVDAR